MIERWEPAPDFEDLYQVSDLGRVRSYHTHRGKYGACLKPFPVRGGYLAVHLSRNGKRTPWRVNRLVMAAFVGRSEEDVNHKNLDKADNALTNLEYLTHAQNQAHAAAAGAMASGEQHGRAKISDADTEMIRAIYTPGQKPSLRELGVQYGLSSGQVGRIVRYERRTTRGGP